MEQENELEVPQDEAELLDADEAAEAEDMEAETTKKEKKHEKAAALQKELEEQKKLNAELNDKLLRQYAEFDNFKKRTIREKEELTGYAKAKCVKEILEVVDNFERALAASADSTDIELRKGVEMIFNQLCEKIKSLGVAEIEALGKPFNPEVHNAVSQVENEEFGENTVCQILQKGYTLDGHVVRHAVVIVANP